MKLKNLHLIISSFIVIPTALIYGFQPDLLVDAPITTIDQANIYKAVMGLYLAFATIWIIGIFKENYWKVATISDLLFMVGLGLGRIISTFIDGMPSNIFIFGTIGELILGFYAIYQLKKNETLQ